MHDWFQGMHGSERVVDAMRAGLFSEQPPDVFTFAAARDLLPDELARRIVRESRLSRLPGIRQVGRDAGRWRYLLPYMPQYFASLDLSAYDVIVASSHACAINVRPRPDALFVCYSHTPMRYAWVPQTDTGAADALGSLGLRLFRRYLRRRDLAASRRPDAFAANSTAVRERIQRFYGRQAEVIHPPVDVGRDRRDAREGAGALPLGAQARPLQAPGARDGGIPRPSVPADDGRGRAHSKAASGSGFRPTSSCVDGRHATSSCELYGRASGFIHVGEEDFGITMVEALAAGTPVVALDAGGARDIVRREADGVLIDRAELRALQTAIRAVAQRSWDRQSLRSRALEFSTGRFLERMRIWLDESSTEARGRPVDWTGPALPR